MTITRTQAHAARILVQWPLDHVARTAGLDEDALGGFESGTHALAADEVERLRHALESGGAVFQPEDGDGGVGVRLRFTARDVKQLDRLEDEGGLVGSDDV